MGHDRYNADSYKQTKQRLDDAGVNAHTYTQTARQRGLGVHDSLNPFNAGYRYSHNPASGDPVTSITFLIDGTGSGGENPGLIRDDLPQLLGLVNLDGYCKHPSFQNIVFGDAQGGDRHVLQVSQFESDGVKIDANLLNIYLSGGGGGNAHESYELAMWYAANMNVLDDWQRGEKGFMFIIGDELPWPVVRQQDVERFVGQLPNEMGFQAQTIEEVVADLKSKYHIWRICCSGSQYWSDESVHNYWRKLIGAEQVILLEDARDISELCAALIGTHVGVGFSKVKADLQALGTGKTTIDNISTALVAAGNSITPTNGSPRVKRL